MEPGTPVTPNERQSLSLSAFIIALVALVFSLFPGWRMFSLVLSLGAFILAAFCLSKAAKAGASRSMPFAALFISLAAAIVSGYFIYKNAPAKASGDPAEEVIPKELTDTTGLNNNAQDAMDKLENTTDSTGK